jgi:hypothetical protein
MALRNIFMALWVLSKMYWTKIVEIGVTFQMRQYRFPHHRFPAGLPTTTLSLLTNACVARAYLVRTAAWSEPTKVTYSTAEAVTSNITLSHVTRPDLAGHSIIFILDLYVTPTLSDDPHNRGWVGTWRYGLAKDLDIHRELVSPSTGFYAKSEK